MQHHTLRGPDNPDYFDTSRLSYVLTCDDPALCKAPFVAAKNVVYPSQHEIDALEYYIEHFVWGKLQRTDKETPYPYGVYGTPNWRVNRDTALRRANVNDRNKDKMHVWRSYDYPHIVMLYYHLYQIAKRYPGKTHYLDAAGYLARARETAKAFFLYPYEILPWYETYKWGCYNELLFVPLMADLEKEGFATDAAFPAQRMGEESEVFHLRRRPIPSDRNTPSTPRPSNPVMRWQNMPCKTNCCRIVIFGSIRTCGGGTPTRISTKRMPGDLWTAR